jgi:hypothetical protein
VPAGENCPSRAWVTVTQDWHGQVLSQVVTARVRAMTQVTPAQRLSDRTVRAAADAAGPASAAQEGLAEPLAARFTSHVGSLKPSSVAAAAAAAEPRRRPTRRTRRAPSPNTVTCKFAGPPRPC